MASEDFLQTLFSSNTSWTEKLSNTHPQLLSTLSKKQEPKILWLGCSDSRVPETTLLNLQPGDVFTHRNIANVVNPTDISLLSVVEYSVGHLGVQEIILCGHTSCGGVAAALANSKVGLGVIDTWLMPLRSVRATNLKELEGIDDPKQRNTRLVELNVLAGTQTLREHPIVEEAIRTRGVRVWGLIYDLETGKLREVDQGPSKDVGKQRELAFRMS